MSDTDLDTLEVYESMYERKADLVAPSSHEGAILFCDLAGSTELARELATAQYFRLIRALWTEIDSIFREQAPRPAQLP